MKINLYFTQISFALQTVMTSVQARWCRSSKSTLARQESKAWINSWASTLQQVDRFVTLFWHITTWVNKIWKCDQAVQLNTVKLKTNKYHHLGKWNMKMWYSCTAQHSQIKNKYHHLGKWNMKMWYSCTAQHSQIKNKEKKKKKLNLWEKTTTTKH